MILYSTLKWTPNQKDKIQHTFKNVGYGVGNHYPRLLKTRRSKNSTLYTYHVPYGLIDDTKLDVLKKTLNRPINITFTNGKLHIRVYKYNLTTHINYDWQTTNGWTIPVGQTHDGMLYHDFDKIPHMTVAGATRNGKTTFLKLLISHLTISQPNNVQFYLIDLKDGLEFNRFSKLRQTELVADTPNHANKALSDILKDVSTNMSYFKSKGYTDVRDTNITTRKFIIIDESSRLDDDTKKKLIDLIQLSGAFGYRVIVATQYPTVDTIPKEVKQNTDCKISFRLPTEIASRVAIDESGAEKLEVPGRMIYRTTEKHIAQVPYIKNFERLKKYECEKNREDTIEIG